MLHKGVETIPLTSKNPFPATFNNVHGSRIISSGILGTEWLGLVLELFWDITTNFFGIFLGWKNHYFCQGGPETNVSFGP